MEGTVMPDGRTLYHHESLVCEGGICPLHNPTDHEYRQYPLDWDDLWGVMVRRVPVDGGVETHIDPDEYKIRNLKKGQNLILENAAKCLECKERIVSLHRHDFVTCSCGNVSVDGGHDYMRRAFKGENWYDDSVIYTKED